MRPSASLPAYQRIVDDLSVSVARGEYPPGARLPSEPQLMQDYQVSFTTVRAAMRLLRVLGLVEIKPGQGTFVVRRRMPRTSEVTHPDNRDGWAGIPEPEPWAESVLAAGRVPTQRLTCSYAPAAEGYAALLDVVPGDPILVHRAWRSIDEQPVAVESAYYPQWLVEAVPVLAQPQDTSQSMASLLADFGYRIGWQNKVPAIREPAGDEVAFFHPPVGVSVLIVTSVCRAEPDRKAIRVVETSYRSDYAEFVARSLPDGSGRGEGDPTSAT